MMGSKERRSFMAGLRGGSGEGEARHRRKGLSEGQRYRWVRRCSSWDPYIHCIQSSLG